MEVIPAIDLMKGKVVRLVKGDPSAITVYSEYPLDIAKRWEDSGVNLLHIVDLDAALGEGDNLGIIEKIISNVKIDVEVGGGLRSVDKIKKVLDIGASRVVIGTKAIDMDFMEEITEEFSNSIVVSVDVWGSNVAIEGWQTHTPINCLELIKMVQMLGIEWIIFTDVSCDGTLRGPNIKEIKKLSSIEGINYIIAGGIGKLEHLISIKQKAGFIWGVILGKSIYEGTISLPDALRILRDS